MAQSLLECCIHVKKHRETHQKLLAERDELSEPIVLSLPPHEEFKEHMGHLYDEPSHLVGIENCSRVNTLLSRGFVNI